jgi:hypothetical protein
MYRVFVLILDDILNNQRNAPVRGLQGVAGNPQFLISIASYL